MKKIVQFNELVFNHTVDIQTQPEIVTDFRISKSSFINNHGDYSPERTSGRKINSKTFSMNIIIDKSKFNCEDRELVEQFVQSNLYKIGRLWAIQGDSLLWAIAKAESVSEGLEEKRGRLSYTVTFYLPQGVWYIADPTATYLEEYHQCDVLECFEVLQRPLCECCWCNVALAPIKMCFKCAGERLCEIPRNDLVNQIGNCGNNKKINYSCDCQEPNILTYSEYGAKTALAEFQAMTFYETDDVVIEICGSFTNLTIEFNGEKSIIEGSYSGETTISKGVVKNNCDYLEISKFHSVCNHECTPNDECGTKPFSLKKNNGSNGIVHWKVNPGKNVIRFFNFNKNETQEIRVFVRGIAL
ncbi:hypothetical protein [Enterococcus sp. AZ177]|uniref:hypothetical protein n=1 Tax=unclassified Enterococcus TaxID=2608891 RepID=UPI003D3001DD